MNLGIIIYILGYILMIEAGLMLIPAVFGLVMHEQAALWFLLVAAAAFVAGALIRRRKPRDNVFYLKEGCITTAAAWLVLSFVGCLPFRLSGAIPSFTDALFETISGFTTTGASIIPRVEDLPMCVLFWRSFSHWIGGMGVLVFLLAIIPLSGGSHMNLMRAESPGPSVSKLVPKVRSTARILYMIYFLLTAVLLVLLLLGRMPAFDALMITFGTAGTGGFGVRSSSCGEYSAYVQWVVGIFMVLFGINFNAYYLILLRKLKDALKMEEIRGYILMVLSAWVLICINLSGSMPTGEMIRHAFFQVASLSTSTGYATLDFDLWPDFSKMVLIIVMFIGACAGSTGGGLKVSRVMLAVKAAIREMNYYLHPKSVRKVKMDGRTVEQEQIEGVGVYLIVFTIVFGISVFLVMLSGVDLMTGFSSVLTTINNMGPGFNAVGPAANFAHMSTLSKYVLMFDMLAGRLELFPMLLLLHPGLWREAAERELRKKRRKNDY